MRNKIKEHLRQYLFNLINKKKILQTNPHDKKIYSQLGEDGFILHVFEKIGVKSKRFAEIGIGDGSECNTRNLIENYGWGGVMVEGNKEKAAKAIQRYKDYPVTVYDTFISPQNVNNFLEKDLDLLSLDIDANDWWVWKAMNFNPRVVILEFNSTFGERFITTPKTHLARLETHPGWLYYGASLNAFVRLGKKKGYKLVYANGTNAIFVRKEIENIKEINLDVAPEDYNRRRWGSPEEQFELIKDKRFVEV